MGSGRPDGVRHPKLERPRHGRYRMPEITEIERTIDWTDPMELPKAAHGGRGSAIAPHRSLCRFGKLEADFSVAL